MILITYAEMKHLMLDRNPFWDQPDMQAEKRILDGLDLETLNGLTMQQLAGMPQEAGGEVGPTPSAHDELQKDNSEVVVKKAQPQEFKAKRKKIIPPPSLMDLNKFLEDANTHPSDCMEHLIYKYLELQH